MCLANRTPDRFHCAEAPWREMLFVIVSCFISASAIRAENWARFRGPNGAGQSDATRIPSKWSESNRLWKRELPGIGHSSPIVWGERLYVLSGDTATGEQIFQALDAQSGAPLWEKRFEAPVYNTHAFNSLASSTPAADEDHVYVMWLADGRITLAAFTHAGDEAWRRDVGPFIERHGFGKSPIVVDDLVCVATDSEADSAIIAVDRTNGDIRWTLPRPSSTTAFATPCVLDAKAADKLLLAISTTTGLTAVDAATGQVAWQGFRNDLPLRCVASPIAAHGLVYILCGQGGNGKHLIAARPSGAGQPPQEAFRLQQGVPQVPTPIVVGDLLFLWHDRGVVTCCEAATGRQLWRERVGGDFHSSPLAIGDRIFCASKQGEMVVVDAAREYKLLGRNELGGPCIATPAVAHDRLYVRTTTTLLCIGEPNVNN